MKTILEVRRDQCHYPADKRNRAGDALFCGKPNAAASSYCAKHHLICYRPTPQIDMRPSKPAPEIGQRPDIKPLDQIFSRKTLRRFEWIK